MNKLAWVLLPLLPYLAWLAWARLRGRLPARHALNAQLSLFLAAYLLATAGLGIFWVASQQLPVFDWHYLFGYVTVALVAAHLWFNLPAALRWLRGARTAATAHAPVRQSAARAGWRKPLLVTAALGAAFWLGSAWRGEPPPASEATLAGEDAGRAAVERFHALSSESRRGVFTRVPAMSWGDAPPAFKRYPDARHIALPRAGAGGPGAAALGAALRGPAARTRPPTLAELGDVLRMTAGVTLRRGGYALRAAPSSGALFPSELYLLVRTVAGLAPGVYHFDPDLGRLAVLGPLPAASGAALADDADATVVLTSVFRRTGYKYGNRAYRYVTADAGHLLENLRVAGHAAALRVDLLPRFDEGQVARALGVDNVEEGVLAVAAMRRGPGAQHAAGGAAPAYRARASTPATLGETGRIHGATSLALAAPDDVIALPAPQVATMPLAQVIAQRRSKRRFTDEAVDLAALSAILAGMAQPVQLSRAVRINLVANRVRGLAPGAYRYGPGHALERVRTGDLAKAAGDAALSQDVIAGAAVVLVLSVERAALLAEGARGYRHGFIEAGMVGERWLLGAVAHGLGACPVGAFYDDEAAALVGLAPAREWVVHFAALGVAAREQ